MPGLSGMKEQLVTVRAIRGAVQVEANERTSILEGTTELVTEVMARNSLVPDDVISVLFTATPDLTAEFPALAARKIGFQDVPLLCGTEIPVPHALPRVVRLMMHIETRSEKIAPLTASTRSYLYSSGPIPRSTTAPAV